MRWACFLILFVFGGALFHGVFAQDARQLHKEVSFTSDSSRSVPSSSRSRGVVRRVAPQLQSVFRDQGLTYGNPMFIRLFKQERQLEVWVKSSRTFTLFRTYAIAAYSGTLGPKLREGDMQAPEGFYYVPPARMNPNSSFHLSFNLGFPNTYDRTHGRTGSALMVHGSNVSIGCYAMTDPGIEEIYTVADAALRNGQRYFRVHCFPFRMTAENMRLQRGSTWYAYWQNLKQGYDFFERTLTPPNVEVRGGRYVFNATTR